MSNTIEIVEDVLKSTYVKFAEFNTNLVLSETNPAKFEKIEVTKVNSNVTTKRQNFDVALHNKTFLSDEVSAEQISQFVNKEFICTLLLTDDVEQVEVYNRKWFGLSSKFDIDKFKQFTEHFDWVIVSDEIINLLKKTISNSEEKQSGDLIYLGKLESKSVFSTRYLNKDQVVLGNYSSINSIFLNRVLIKQETNIYKIDLQYLIEAKEIRKLILK